MKRKRTMKPVFCGRHFRVWENQRGMVAWDDESKSRQGGAVTGRGDHHR